MLFLHLSFPPADELVHSCLADKPCGHPAGFLFPQETKAVHGGKHSRKIVHRVGLFDRQGQMTHILSQSDVVR